MPNYGYSFPKKPELGSYRFVASESEIRRYLAQFPRLAREQILAEMIAARPDRLRLEERLQRLSDQQKEA